MTGACEPPPTEGVDLWLCDPDEPGAGHAGEPELGAPQRGAYEREAYELGAAELGLVELLDGDERRRYERFRVERARRLFLAGRALVRTTLSRYAEVEPRDWRFRFGAHGRPEILAPEGLPLVFNLSHTDGLVACGVTAGGELGVDVEEISRARRLRRLADHTFAPEEAAEVRAAAEADRRRRFFSYWTLKEAYVKARGEGMSLPLKRFAFSFPEPGRIDARFDPEVDPDGAGWGFALYEATPRHLLAVARRPNRGLGGTRARRVRLADLGTMEVALRRLGRSP